MMDQRFRSLIGKALLAFFCLFSVFLLTGCDALYRLLQKEGAEEKDLIGEVDPFTSNPKVEEVQKLLKLYGYKVGVADGRLGHNTRYAIEEFQKDNNLKITRFIDAGTWESLNIFRESQLVVNGEINLIIVQTALKNAGFSPGKIDGKSGAQTEKAVKRFQEAMGLKADGRVGFKTLRELKDFLP
ncbi:MAG: peptidoglycan-binding protein [Candidatus Omnitrophota bacterium]